MQPYRKIQIYNKYRVPCSHIRNLQLWLTILAFYSMMRHFIYPSHYCPPFRLFRLMWPLDCPSFRSPKPLPRKVFLLWFGSMLQRKFIQSSYIIALVSPPTAAIHVLYWPWSARPQKQPFVISPFKMDMVHERYGAK